MFSKYRKELKGDVSILKRLTFKQKFWLKVFHKPYGTNAKVNIFQIEVPYSFSSPSGWKVKEYYKRYCKYNMIDKPITISVNKNPYSKFEYALEDGYIRFSICMQKIKEFQSLHNSKRIPKKLLYIPVHIMKEGENN